eukprot:Hpha_TRINITY_DN15317_c0_g13::TRINITY_DN15317_c0_g13_i1::g.89540::m.89540
MRVFRSSVALLGTVACVGAQTLPNWDYDPSYHSSRGPTSWATQSRQTSNACAGDECEVEFPYSQCAGQMQSPVNVRTAELDQVSIRRGAVLQAYTPLVPKVGSVTSPTGVSPPSSVGTAPSGTTTASGTTTTGAAAGTTTATTPASANAATTTTTSTSSVRSERVVNDGHGVRVVIDFARQYLVSPLFPHNMVLHEIRYRTPSEHTIDGERFDVERQLVYKVADLASLQAVVGVIPDPPTVRVSTFYREAGTNSRSAATQQTSALTGTRSPVAAPLPDFGDFLSDSSPTPDDPVLTSLHGHLQRLRRKGDQLYLFDFVPPTEYLGDRLFMYQGSETEPPCRETTTWILSREIRSVSPLSLGRLRSTLPEEWGNARPLQPLGARQATAFRPYTRGGGVKAIYGELARAEVKREEMRTASQVRSDGQGNGDTMFEYRVIRDSETVTQESKKTEEVLREVTVALAITFALLLCGLIVLILVRQGIIAPYMLPAWLGGIEEPGRERWSNTVTDKDVFGGVEVTTRGEEMDEEYPEESQDGSGDGDDDTE